MNQIAGVFAGQGAQAVGMGRDLAEAFPGCQALYDRASAVLGYDLSDICFKGPAEKLTRSDVCQPAIFVTSAVCWAALAERRPNLAWAALAGLSLGEWTALYAAGVLDFENTVHVLQARGRFMQEACEQRPGGMISLMGLEPEEIEAICVETGLTVANLNSTQQTVLSGPLSAIPDAERLAREKGAQRAIALNVAGAFHSPLMAPAREKLADVLSKLTLLPPERPVLSNVTGTVHENDGQAIREAMLRQITEPVRWLDNIRWCLDQKIDTFIEMGPGKVLTGLIKRIDRQVTLWNVQDASGLEPNV